MARVFITGSSDGLGQMAANQLINQGHQVVLHARNEKRARDAMENTHGAETVLIGDLADLEETRQLALDANETGVFDAVIHNAGVYQSESQTIIKVNTLAPYILTSLMLRPKRLIYLSSGMHLGGHANLNALAGMNGISYSDSKLHDLLLTKVVARRWPDVYANAVDPGWVPTKMGGASATDDLAKGYQTQAWLAVSEEQAARVSGDYFYHMKPHRYNSAADDVNLQDRFVEVCEKLTGIDFG